MTDPKERARERARETVSKLLSGRYKEGQWIYGVPNLGAALEEALLNVRRETLEKAALRAYDHLVGLPDCQRRVARAIRRLEKE